MRNTEPDIRRIRNARRTSRVLDGGDWPIQAALKRQRISRDIVLRVTAFTTVLSMLEDLDALFTTLNTPLARLATRLRLESRAAPLALFVPEASIISLAAESAFKRFLMQVLEEWQPQG